MFMYSSKQNKRRIKEHAFACRTIGVSREIPVFVLEVTMNEKVSIALERMDWGIALLARGLEERRKLSEEKPDEYPASLRFRKGGSMLLSACLELGLAPDEVFALADEASLFERVLIYPISDFLSKMPEEIVKLLEKQAFYDLGPLAVRYSETEYVASPQCLDYSAELGTFLFDDLAELKIYKILFQSNDETFYRDGRLFLITHPVATESELRAFIFKYGKDFRAEELILTAYEAIPDGSRICERCGWTITKDRHGCHCSSARCVEPEPIWSEQGLASAKLRRLTPAAMRYIARPGMLELDIRKLCLENGCEEAVLWPSFDKWDVRVKFRSGKVWMIDAKDYANPHNLRRHLEISGGFPEGAYDRGFVVYRGSGKESEYGFQNIVNGALNTPRVICASLADFEKALKKAGRKENGYGEE